MATSVGDLTVNVSTNTASLEAGMAKAADVISRNVARMSSQFDAVSSRVSSVTTNLNRLAGVALGGLAVNAFSDLIKGSIDAQAKMQDLGEKVGATASQMSQLIPAAKLSGTSMDAVGAASVKFSKSLAEAKDGSGKAAEALKLLGFNSADAARFMKNPTEGLHELAKASARFKDDGNKTALMMQLLGKSAAELGPFMKELGVQTELVTRVTDEQAAAAKRLQDEWALLELRQDEIKNQIAADLVPAFLKMIDVFNMSRVAGRGFAESLADAVNVTVNPVSMEQSAAQIAKLSEEVKRLEAGAAAAKRNNIWSFLAISDEQVAETKRQLAFFQGLQRQAAMDWAKGLGDLSDQVSRRAGAKQSLDFKITSSGGDKLGKELDALEQKWRDQITGAADVMKALRELNKLYDAGRLTLEEYRKGVDVALGMDKKRAEELKRLEEITKSYNKVLDSLEDSEQARIDTIRRVIESIEDQNAALANEITTLGLTGTALELRLSQIERESALKKADGPLQVDRINKLYDERDALIKTKGAAEQNIKLAQENAQAWADMFSGLADRGADFIADFVANGSKAFKRLWEDFKNWALTALARIAAQKVVVSLAGSLGVALPGGASAGGFDLSSLLKLPGGGGGGFLESILGGGGGGAGVFAEGAAPLATSAVSGFSTALGAGFSAGIETLSIAATAGTAAIGGFGAALGAFAAVAGPVALAVGAAYMIADALGAFEHGGPKGGGSAFAGGDATMGRFFTPADSDATVQQVVDSISATYLGVADALGADIAATFGLGFDTDPQGTASNRISSAVSVGGQVVRSVSDLDVGRDDEQLTAALAVEAQRSLLAALQASNFPSYLASVFNSVDAATASAETVQQLIATATALKQTVTAVAALGGQFAEMQPEQILGLVEAFGGLDELTQGFGYLEENFTTQADKLKASTDELTAGFAELGVAIPASHEDFRALVDSLIAAGDAAGAASLVALAPLFVEVAGTADQAAAALTSAATATDKFTTAAAELVPALTGHTPADFISEQRQIWADRLTDLDSLAGQGVTFADQLSLSVTLIGSQITTLERKMAQALAGGTSLDMSNFQYIFTPALKEAKKAYDVAVKELARFTILTAQFGEAKAQQLLALEQWFSEQQQIFAGNAAALDAASSIFDQKWKAIIDGTTTGVDGTLDQLKRLQQGLAEYLQRLVISEISPLTPEQKLGEARANLDATIAAAQGGDLSAIGRIPQVMDAFLQLDRDFKAGTQSFVDDFTYYTNLVGGIAGTGPNGMPVGTLEAVLPTSGTLASSEDLAATRALLQQLITDLAKANTADSIAEREALVKAANQISAALESELK